MTTSLREKMSQDLQLAGLSQRSQEAYLRAVRQLADHFHLPPDQLSEQQLRDYFLQHVLPSGFQKVRHYGFLGANCLWRIEAVRWLVSLYYGLLFVLRAKQPLGDAAPRIRCPQCGGPMLFVEFVPAWEPLIFDTS